MARTKSNPKPPSHLSKSTAAWWSHVVTEYELDQHHERLLTLACEAYDRATEAREAVAKYGVVVLGAGGSLKPNPACNIERDSRIAFARLVRDLGLDDDEPAPPARGKFGRT